MKFLNRIALAVLITSLASVSVFAKTKKEKVKFPTNVKVNGTLINQGEYDVKFDDKTGELSIEKGSKVIAKATASVQKRVRKAQRLEFRTTGTGDETLLTGVTFTGTDQDVKSAAARPAANLPSPRSFGFAPGT